MPVNVDKVISGWKMDHVKVWPSIMEWYNVDVTFVD